MTSRPTLSRWTGRNGGGTPDRSTDRNNSSSVTEGKSSNTRRRPGAEQETITTPMALLLTPPQPSVRKTETSSLADDSMFSKWSNTSSFPEAPAGGTPATYLLGNFFESSFHTATAATHQTLEDSHQSSLMTGPVPLATSTSNTTMNNTATTTTMIASNHSGIPVRPTAIWKVSDTGVPVRPSLWPTMVRSDRIRIDGPVPASTVACRIAECLWKRSIVVDYDDEACRASCWTVDQCHFVVHLWRSRDDHGRTMGTATSTATTSSSVLSNTNNNDSTSMLSAVRASARKTLWVECVRTSGSVVTFHRTVSAIRDAATSMGSGRDARSRHAVGPREFNRLPLGLAMEGAADAAMAGSGRTIGSGTNFYTNYLRTPALKQTDDATSTLLEPATTDPDATLLLEYAYQCLCKDRLEAQLYGMEMLVTLTDPTNAAVSTARKAARTIVGHCDHQSDDDPTQQYTGSGSGTNVVLQTLYKDWILGLLVHRRLPYEPVSDQDLDESSRSAAAVLSDNDTHAREMRALALRAYANALGVLSTLYNPSHSEAADDDDGRNENGGNYASTVPLLPLALPVASTRQVVAALQNDLQGARRPVHGRLATPHDAALAAHAVGLLAHRFPEHLGIVAGSSGSAGDGGDSLAAAVVVEEEENYEQWTSALLECAAIGRSTHAVLTTTARDAYQVLTRDDRSC